MSVLEIKDLHVEIEGKKILKGVNLTLKTGEVAAIMGPNGTGKSTLMKTLMGRIPALGGSFLFGYQIEKGYLGSELFIETEKETIEFWDWKKHLKYTEKADSFFEFLTRKKVSINFDFKNKKFHFEDDIDENHKIETVKKIEKILKNVLQFGYASEFDDMLKMFENYLAKFKNKKVDERIEMIKNFKI